ncbi:MAG: dihydrolipoamide acetyltransferase family protein [Xanthomonadales bacterium]|nr:dihydrolipoamide acetyltransferase family protein [Xanthomonadales bacterium]
MSEYIFKLPDLGEGTVEAEIAEWMVKVGDRVAEEDPICAMLTDKAAVELSAPVSGKVVSLAGEEGDNVTVGTPLIVFETSEQPAESDRSATAEEAGAGEMSATETAHQEKPRGPGKVMTSPSIRAQARKAGIDLTQVPGSGPRGRILKADYEAYLEGREAPSPEIPAVSSKAAPAAEARTGTTEIKVIGLRRKIAERMAQSASEIPHFTFVEEVDVTALESLRNHLNAQKSADQPPLSLLVFLGLALTRVLKYFPQCNAHYDSEHNVIVRYEAVHLGIATQTDDGLKVPVVKHCENRGLEDLAAEIRRVSGAARDNSASREELSGSTITISSLGRLGGIVSTPVINQPEVGIIGVNKAVDRPVVADGQVVVRTMMNLSSSFDHRFVDGYDAAAMIQALRALLEQPATIFMPD